MSLTFTQSGLEFPWEGVNEKGLAVTIMMLASTAVPPVTDARPALNGLQWIQYLLDTSATVEDAIANAQKTRIIGPVADRQHYLVCDARALCATFEYIDERLVIHAGAQLPIATLTNDPYEKSLQYFADRHAQQSEDDILRSTAIDSITRFSKAAIFSERAALTNTSPDEFAFAALNSVHQPTSQSHWPTQWSLVFSLATQVVQLKTLQAPSIKIIDLKTFNSSCSTPTQYLDINSADLTQKFSDFTFEANQSLINQSALITQDQKDFLAHYPSQHTKCLE